MRLKRAIQQYMVFLIFTRSNLYLGINGRITELLPFGDQAYLALKNYRFPEDLDSLFHLIRTEVEAYFDRTAFGVPSNLNVLAVYSEAIEDDIKREINNEFADFLPVGWIWDASIQADTDHLDSESYEMQPISLRRMVKKIKSETLIGKNISWQSNHGAGVQVLVPQMGSPLLPDPKRRVPKMPEMPKLPALPNISVSLPKVPKINPRLPKMPSRPKMPSMPSLPSISLPRLSLPAMPEVGELNWRRYRIVIPGVVLFGIAGFLIWPDGSDNGSRERNTSLKLPVEPVANHESSIHKTEKLVDTTANYTESLTATEIAELANRSAKPDSSSLGPNSKEISSEQIAAANTGLVGKGPQEKNTDTLANTLAAQGEIPDTANVAGTSIAANKPDTTDSNQGNTSSQPNNVTAENSSLSLSDYAKNSRDAYFMGGSGAIFNYFIKNLRYPKSAKRKNIKGEVLVGFEVDVEGRVVKPYVIRGIGYGCDEEAIRLVANMPSWNPATVMRKRVSSKHTITVPFN